jgi:hypothetical protein
MFSHMMRLNVVSTERGRERVGENSVWGRPHERKGTGRRKEPCAGDHRNSKGSVGENRCLLEVRGMWRGRFQKTGIFRLSVPTDTGPLLNSSSISSHLFSATVPCTFAPVAASLRFVRCARRCSAVSLWGWGNPFALTLGLLPLASNRPELGNRLTAYTTWAPAVGWFLVQLVLYHDDGGNTILPNIGLHKD